MILKEFISDKSKFFDIIKNNWLEASDTFPDFLLEISNEKKHENEQYITNLMTALHKQISNFPRIPVGRKKWTKDTYHILNDVLYHEDILGMHHYMSQAETDAFVLELKEFLRHVRQFAPELTIDDIGQAIRNYIVYAMFKKVHKVDSGFHIAAFGYSMLYPFTDNYIDNKSLTALEKAEYNHIIKDKLEGRVVHPGTPHQAKTCQLLQYIEDLYPRTKDSDIYLLLLMMLEAQEISIKQQNKDLPLTLPERLDISIYKGGISVFMDRYFVEKEITKDDLIFYLGFGFFLQLADDLQDIREDSDLGHSNLFTLDLKSDQEEKVVNKLLHFVHRITKDYSSDHHVINFLLLNSYQLINSSVIRSREFFSKEYLHCLEKHLPVSYDYWERLSITRNDSLDKKMQKKYMTILDELIK